MAPTYAQCDFQLYLPTCVKFEDHVKISYKLQYKNENIKQIVFYKAILRDRVNVAFEDSESVKLFNRSSKLNNATVSFVNTKKKVFIRDSVVTMIFFTDKEDKVSIQFEFDREEKSHLKDVSIEKMSAEEKDLFTEVCLRQVDVKSETQKHSAHSEYTEERSYSNVKMVAKDIPGLEKYINALRTEKKYLQNEGGRRYKVTNGKLVSKSKDGYSYVFDLDAEIYIADDAPVKLSYGMQKVNGTVLMCEDFQMIVQIGSHIGERIHSAEVVVEPWKLLEALEEKLQRNLEVGFGHVPKTLFDEGPGLATKQSSDAIPKGQDKVIEHAMTEPISIVWGPPGTGKTHTMSEIAINFMKQNKKVLIVSHSNVSVDGVAAQIRKLLDKKHESFLYEKGQVLRYGYVRDESLKKDEHISSFLYTVKKNPSLSSKMDELMDEYEKLKRTHGIGSQRIIDIRREITEIRSHIREQEQQYVESAQIVATTISKVVIDKLFEHRKYDVVMFDEVSMAYVAQVICAATYAQEHFIAVGDFKQLAPIAQSEAKEVLCRDIFDFLGINVLGETHYHPWLVMLNEQRRMHPKISAFINQNVYERKLKDHESVLCDTKKYEVVNSELFKGKAINLIDLSGSYCAAYKDANNSRFNLLSAFMSFAMAIKTEENAETVSIITPYAAQTRLIRALILDYRIKHETELKCATVHQFQGSQSDVVIFDAVESFPSKKPGVLMAKEIDSVVRLINVAVSRAKAKLITISNATFWRECISNKKHLYLQLIDYISKTGNKVQHVEDRSLEKLIEELSVNGGPQFWVDPEKYYKLLEQDWAKAKHKIIVSLPAAEINKKYGQIFFDWVLEAEKKGIEILIKTCDFENFREEWASHVIERENAIFPLIVIDDKVLWYGAPLASWNFSVGQKGFSTVCPVACRIEGEHTVEIVKSLTDLEDVTSKVILKEGQGHSLAKYVAETRMCQCCQKPFMLSRGKSGKLILWCKECGKPELLSPEEVNHYICKYRVTCPTHNTFVEAKLGKWGLYVKCDCGDTIKPEDI